MLENLTIAFLDVNDCLVFLGYIKLFHWILMIVNSGMIHLYVLNITNIFFFSASENAIATPKAPALRSSNSMNYDSVYLELRSLLHALIHQYLYLWLLYLYNQDACLFRFKICQRILTCIL
jgi:hypothetical protein